MKKRDLILVVCSIIALWGASWIFIPILYNKEELEAGTFGDMFGAVNALFSGLAFAGLIYTIAVQRQELQSQNKSIEMQTEELRLQREAIQMQTEELGLQRKAIEMQTEEIKMQREETARSADQLEGQKNLLNLQMAMSVVNDLIQTKNKKTEHKYRIPGYSNKLSYFDMVNFNQHDSELFTEDATHLQTYLDTFFFILKFIQEYDLQKEQKDMLDNLVNMNTTDVELILIYLAVAKNQHRLTMLHVHGFYPRHQKLTGKTTIPS